MMENWVQDMVEDTFGNPLSIGVVTVNPDTGRTVKITEGQFWGEHGLSNFWYWEDIETGEKGHGYGWEAGAPR